MTRDPLLLRFLAPDPAPGHPASPPVARWLIVSDAQATEQARLAAQWQALSRAWTLALICAQPLIPALRLGAGPHIGGEHAQITAALFRQMTQLLEVPEPSPGDEEAARPLWRGAQLLRYGASLVAHHLSSLIHAERREQDPPLRRVNSAAPETPGGPRSLLQAGCPACRWTEHEEVLARSGTHVVLPATGQLHPLASGDVTPNALWSLSWEELFPDGSAQACAAVWGAAGTPELEAALERAARALPDLDPGVRALWSTQAELTDPVACVSCAHQAPLITFLNAAFEGTVVAGAARGHHRSWELEETLAGLAHLHLRADAGGVPCTDAALSRLMRALKVQLP